MGKFITDPTLEFFDKRLKKIYDLKGLKNRNVVAFLKVKLFVENLPEEKKTVFSKNKRPHNLETLK